MNGILFYFIFFLGYFGHLNLIYNNYWFANWNKYKDFYSLLPPPQKKKENYISKKLKIIIFWNLKKKKVNLKIIRSRAFLFCGWRNKKYGEDRIKNLNDDSFIFSLENLKKKSFFSIIFGVSSLSPPQKKKKNCMDNKKETRLAFG